MPSEPTNFHVDNMTASDVAAALDAAEDHVEVLDTPDNGNVLVVARRDDYTVEVHDLERYQPQPSRPKGTVRALTANGFVQAVGHRRALHEEAETVIYSNVDSLTLTAVLNDDHDGLAGWRDHRVTWSPQATPEWDHWTRHIGLHDQEMFAAVIEEGETDIINPSATVMLDLAQTFEASTSARFKKAGRVKDGRTQLVYEEEIEAKAGSSEGLVDIPESFTVELRPFYGADAEPVQCKIRYRLNGGQLKIGYTITRPDEIRRDAFTSVVDGLAGNTSHNLVFVDGIPAEPGTAGR